MLLGFRETFSKKITRWPPPRYESRAALTAPYTTLTDSTMGADDGLEDAREVLRLAHHRSDTREGQPISQRDLHRALARNRFPTIGVVREALEALEAEGWAAEVPPAPAATAGGRPPSPRWCFHPENAATKSTELTKVPIELGSDGSAGCVTTNPLRDVS